jgi:hypothetical protein
MASSMRGMMRRCSSDSDGAGDKAFIAGEDISELSHATALEAEKSSRSGQQCSISSRTWGNPVIAAVNGLRSWRLRDGDGVHDQGGGRTG